MNSVVLIGRLTRDPDVRYTQEGKAVARFTLAVDRHKDETDFPSVVSFGRTAEIVEQYAGKGKQVAIQGSIHTGAYTDKNGKKVYFTEVIGDKVQLLGNAEKKAENGENSVANGFEYIDEELPF